MAETPPAVVHRRGLREYGVAAAGEIVLATLALICLPAYPWLAITCFAAAAVAIAQVDARTQLLPNRYTGPLALAAVIQVAAVSIHGHNLGIALSAAAAAAVVFTGYALMGMAGWFGFGDAKFAAGLALFAGIYAGWFAVYLLPVAVLISAAQRAITILRGRGRRAHPHGPALTAAFIVITGAALLL